MRLPKSLNAEVAKVAKRDGTSINQFIAIAGAEKILALETERFFAERAKQANMEEFQAILFRPGGGLREPETNLSKINSCLSICHATHNLLDLVLARMLFTLGITVADIIAATRELAPEEWMEDPAKPPLDVPI